MKKIMKKASALILAGACLLSSVGGGQITSQAKANDWTQMKKNENVWEQEQAGSSPYAYRALYINGDQLFERVRYRSNQESGGQKITKWKMNKEMEGLSLAAVKGNTAYVQWYNEEGSTRLYSVNVKTKKKKVVSKKFNRCAGTSDYVYANNCKPSDTGAYAVSVWKVNKNSIRKVKTLGKYIFGTTIYGKYAYYGKYNSISQKTVVVYRCNLNGSHAKKLFTVKATDKYAQSLMTGVENNKITVYTTQNGKNVLYTYNIKTKKKTKKIN